MATSPSFNWPEPDNTDLVKNGALAIRTAVDAIDTSMTDLLGGTTGQVLSKTSNTDMDFTWVSDATGMTNPMTTTGDVIYSSSGSTPARLGIGTAGQVLQVNSGATAPEWATPAGGGKVLQVVNATTSTQISSATNTFVDSNLTATITPTLSNSKILVIVSQSGLGKDSGSAATYGVLQLLRGATVLAIFEKQFVYTNSVLQLYVGGASINYLDSPATTSATTYKTQIKNGGGAGTVFAQVDSTVSSITLLEIGA